MIKNQKYMILKAVIVCELAIMVCWNEKYSILMMSLFNIIQGPAIHFCTYLLINTPRDKQK